jgi:hypothetical protein
MDIELLRRYLNGDCSDEENEIVREWYASFDNDDSCLDYLTAQEREQLKLMMLTVIIGKIKQRPAYPTKGARLYTLPIAIIKVAVAAMIIITCGVWAYDKYYKSSDKHPLAAAPLLIKNNGLTIFREVLPDNTIVWLSPGAQVQYPAVFSGSDRKISIKGACFLEVATDPDHPFIINSENLVTRVLGTSFRINDNGDPSTAEVVVLLGSVAVSGRVDSKAQQHIASAEVILHKQEKGQFSKDGGQLVILKQAEVPEMRIWKKASLSFGNVAMVNIIAVLNRQFAVNIVADNNQINNFSLNADLRDFSLPEILEVFKRTLAVDYEIKGDTIHLIVR